MSVYKNLTKIASDLDAVADHLEKSAAAAETAVGSKISALAKKASEVPAPVQPDPEAKVVLGHLAKQASAALLAGGLISSQEKADQFASAVLDHKGALQQLAKLAQAVQKPLPMGKAASVTDTSEDEETADARWDKRASAVLANMNLGY